MGREKKKGKLNETHQGRLVRRRGRRFGGERRRVQREGSLRTRNRCDESVEGIDGLKRGGGGRYG